MNAVIYARYSSHNQNEQSIEGQLSDCYAWAQKNDVIVIGEYIDRALSGTVDKRPDFQRMIADAAKHQFQAVLVWKLDRFSRNRYDSAIYKSKLKKNGVRVVSVMENITDSPEGIILEGLLESMAEYYSANLSENIRRGQRESIKNGTFLGGVVPYGYKSIDKKLVIDDRAAPVVRHMFMEYSKGVGTRDIINDLNARGFRNAHGKPFRNASVTRILSNTVYIGKYVYNGEIIEGLAERLIDDNIYDKVQARLAINKRRSGSMTAKVDYLLSGKCYCGLCNSSMVGDSGTSRRGDMYYYYTCGAKKKKTGACSKQRERKDFLEWYIVEQTIEYVLDPARADYIATAVVKEYAKEFSNDGIAEIEKAIRQLDNELDKLIDTMLETPKGARSRVAARMEQIDIEKKEYENELAKLRISARMKLTKKEVLAWLNTFRSGDPLDVDFCRRVIDVFINSVYLYDDRIIVFYNVRGGKEISYIDIIDVLDLPADDLDNEKKAESTGSTFNPNGGANALKIEPKFIFVSGLFGCIFERPR